MTRRETKATALALVLLCAACAPKQRIPLAVSPHPATVYVDGEALEVIPGEIELRSDRAHVLFFKSEGYRPERVVLESVEVEGKPRLQPAQVNVSLAPATRGGRQLSIEPTEP